MVWDTNDGWIDVDLSTLVSSYCSDKVSDFGYSSMVGDVDCSSQST